MKTPAWLTQNNFPFLWSAMQLTIGGSIDKARLYREFARGKRTILEIGCSTGNTAFAFSEIPELDYVGLDIDPVVIAYAKKKFRNKPNFQFICQDVQTFSQTNRRFDLVLLAGVLHHVGDSDGIALLQACKAMVSREGAFVAIDPMRPGKDSTWLIHTFMGSLEKGQFVRSDEEYRALFLKAGLSVAAFKKVLIGATPFSMPKVSEFASYVFDPGSPNR